MRVDASGIVSEAWREVMDMSTGDVVKQYETAKWDQLSPYNKFCPMINNVRTVTGCVATAMAILMRYHQWPDAGTGTLPAYTYTANIRHLVIVMFGIICRLNMIGSLLKQPKMRLQL